MGNLLDVTAYRVNDCYATVQGEGCLTGTAMVLLRLHGCGVGCPWCDTAETWAVDPPNRRATLAAALGANPLYAELDTAAIAAAIARDFAGPRWVLVTGGEPAEQELGPLVDELHARGYRAALETSGTALGHVGVPFDWVCVSPKIGMPGGKPIRPDAFIAADEVKMVVGKPADLDRLDALLATLELPERTQICLQPLSTRSKATALCIETAIARGWRVSLQLHKYIDQR